MDSFQIRLAMCWKNFLSQFLQCRLFLVSVSVRNIMSTFSSSWLRRKDSKMYTYTYLYISNLAKIGLKIAKNLRNSSFSTYWNRAGDETNSQVWPQISRRIIANLIFLSDCHSKYLHNISIKIIA